MIYGATFRCPRRYGSDLPSSLYEAGYDRIKLHSGKITAKYKVPYNICTTAACQIQKDLQSLKGGEAIEDVKFRTARRYSFILPFYKLWWRINPKSRRRMSELREWMEF